MKLHSFVLVGWGGVMVAATVPSIARADDAADAKGLFAQGRDLRSRGDCADALPLFQRAYALYPAGLGSLRNVAVCEELLGRFASSRRSWLELKRALATTDDRKYAGWAQDTESAAARLAPKVAWLTACSGRRRYGSPGGSGASHKVALLSIGLP